MNKIDHRENGIYRKDIAKAIMTIVGIIGILLVFIAAIGLLFNITFVKSFFDNNQWAYAALAICFSVLSYVLILQQEKEKKVTSMEGTLGVSSSYLKNLVFSTKDNIYPIVQLGTSDCRLILKGSQGKLIVLPEDQYIAVSNDQGKVKLSTKLRGKSGLIVEIIDNEWRLNPLKLWDRNYNDNALEVKDENGVVLQIKVLSDRIQLQAIYYDKNGNGVVIGGNQEYMGGHGIIEKTGPNCEPNYTIKPIFKYPSNLHFGETAN